MRVANKRIAHRQPRRDQVHIVGCVCRDRLLPAGLMIQAIADQVMAEGGLDALRAWEAGQKLVERARTKTCPRTCDRERAA